MKLASIALAVALVAGTVAVLPAETSVDAHPHFCKFREVVCIEEGYQCQFSHCHCYYLLGDELFCEY